LLEPIPDVRQLSGGAVDVRITGGLGRLRPRIAAFVPIPEEPALRGQVAAHAVVRLRDTGDVTFETSADVTNFAVGPPRNSDWAEPKLLVGLNGSFARTTNALAVQAAKVERPGLTLALAGSIDKLDTTADANLTGTVAYDLAKLTPRLRELLGGDFAAKGT